MDERSLEQVLRPKTVVAGTLGALLATVLMLVGLAILFDATPGSRVEVTEILWGGVFIALFAAPIIILLGIPAGVTLESLLRGRPSLPAQLGIYAAVGAGLGALIALALGIGVSAWISIGTATVTGDALFWVLGAVAATSGKISLESCWSRTRG